MFFFCFDKKYVIDCLNSTGTTFRKFVMHKASCQCLWGNVPICYGSGRDPDAPHHP